MKIAVSTSGNTAESEIDSRFGRSPWFMIYDLESGLWKAIENTTDGSDHGAGVQASQRLIEESVQAVITAKVGPKAEVILKEARIAVYLRSVGSAAEAVAAFTKGTLEVS